MKKIFLLPFLFLAVALFCQSCGGSSGSSSSGAKSVCTGSNCAGMTLQMKAA